MHAQLTPRQRRFVREYLADNDAAAAAVRAGYSARGAARQAARLLKQAGVRALIEAGLSARAAHPEISQADVLAELARIAFCDPRAFVSRSGSRITLTAPDGISAEEAAAISEIAESAGGVRIRFYDKLKAVELLMRHKGMLAEPASEADRCGPDSAACQKMALEAQETLRRLRRQRALQGAQPHHPDGTA